MLAEEMTDEVEEAAVESMDRAELIRLVRQLEGQRSAWELRIRACQERETLFKSFVEEIAMFLSMTLQKQQTELVDVGKRTIAMMETIQKMMESVEVL